VAQGLVATAQGIGASLSGLAAGVVVDRFGYDTAFVSLGAAAGVAVLVLALLMPETAPREGAAV
jgi:sugar phosphate permease